MSKLPSLLSVPSRDDRQTDVGFFITSGWSATAIHKLQLLFQFARNNSLICGLISMSGPSERLSGKDYGRIIRHR